MWVSCILFLRNGMRCLYVWNAGAISEEHEQEQTGARPRARARQAGADGPNRCSTSTVTFRRSSPSSPTNCRAARPWSIRSALASTSRNGGSCRCSRSSRKFRRRASATSSASTRDRSAGRWPAMEERGLVSIRADRQDGRTHSISLTAKGLHDPRPGDRGRARTRTPPAVLPEQAGAGNPDRTAAAGARQSRRREGRGRSRRSGLNGTRWQQRRRPLPQRQRADALHRDDPIVPTSVSPCTAWHSLCSSIGRLSKTGSHKLVALATNLSARNFVQLDQLFGRRVPRRGQPARRAFQCAYAFRAQQARAGSLSADAGAAGRSAPARTDLEARPLSRRSRSIRPTNRRPALPPRRARRVSTARWLM